jgi:hypothetical protein
MYPRTYNKKNNNNNLELELVNLLLEISDFSSALC